MSNKQKPPARSGQVQRRVQPLDGILRRYLGSALPLDSVAGSDALRAVQAAYRAGLRHGAKDERERICEAIQQADDEALNEANYMLDSKDCIKVARGQWNGLVPAIG